MMEQDRYGRGHEVYIWLRDAIVGGRLRPSDFLSEVALAKQFKISRTPVREALMRLAGDGLVVNTPGRGSRVAEISLTDVNDLFQMREALEGLAARLAAENRTADSREIDDLIQQFRLYEQMSDTPSSADYQVLTTRMDGTIVARSGNRWLESSLRDIWAHSRRLRQVASHEVPRLEASATEHIAILEAIRDGRAKDAEESVRRHLRNSRQALLAKVMGGQP